MKMKHSKLLLFCLVISMVFSFPVILPTTNVSADTNVIPQSQMSATASSARAEFPVSNVLDGDTGTYWHSEWPGYPLPQYITLDLGGTYNVTSLRYYPKQSWPGDNGVITSYKVYISTNGTDFSEAASGTWEFSMTEKTALFTAVPATHVRLEAIAGSGDVAAASEINIEYENIPIPTPSPSPSPSATPAGEVPQSQMTAEATSARGDNPPSHAIDGDAGTYWHSETYPVTPLPQSITLNLNGTYAVHKVRYIPKQDYIGDGGVITEYKIYLSSNGTDFAEAAEGTWANDAAPKTVIFTPTEASFVRLEAIAAQNNVANAKEIKIYYGGEQPTPSPTPPPDGEIGLILLNPSMVQPEEIAFYMEDRGILLGDAGMLVDEQDQIGYESEPDPFANFQTNWKPAWDADYYPASAFIDLGRDYRLDRIYLYDSHGEGDIIFSYGEPFNWTEMFRDPMNGGWNSWLEHDVSSQSIVTRYIRITKTADADMKEIAIYGATEGPAPEPEELPPHIPMNIPVNEAMGMNAFNDDPVDRMLAVGHVREYNCWAWTTHGADPDPLKLEVAPNPWGWHFDNFYLSLKDAGLMAYVCMQQSPPWVAPKGPNKPLSPGESSLDPASYSEHAAHMFQYAARYGTAAVDDSRLNLAANQPRNSGMNLINYHENWNEQNQTWDGKASYFDPYEFAAMTSADYDGHEGTLGSNYGVKNADPNAKLIMGGLAGANHVLEYIKLMKLWFEYNRTDKKFAADVVNFHYYSSTGTTGASPEATGMKDVLKKVADYCHEYLPEQEVWLSEFGWDTHPGTPVSAPSMEVQGQWIVRGYLAGLAAGLDRVTMYMLRDAIEGSSQMFDTSGLVSGKGSWNPKPSWYYTYTMKNILKNMVFDSVIKEDGNVWVYKFRSLNTENPTYSYAVWCPTSNGTTVNGYELDIEGAQEATLSTLAVGQTSGIQSELAAIDGKVTVNVSERPIFVTTGQIPSGLEVNGTSNIILPYEGQTTTEQFNVMFKDQNGGPMVNGDNTWSVTDESGNPVSPSVMDISSTGLLTVYTATMEGNYKVIATSTENPLWFGEKAVILQRAVNEVADIEISGPAGIAVPLSGSQEYNYQAVVKNQFDEDMPAEEVIWSVMDITSQPADEEKISIDEEGVLTVSSTADTGLYLVKAASVTNPSIVSTKLLTLVIGSGGEPYTLSASFKVGDTPDASVLVGGEALDATITLTNNNAAENSLVMITALYQGETLMNYSFVSKVVEIGETVSMHGGFLLPSDISNCSVKAFVCNGTDISAISSTPVSEVYEID